jgi:hypothetical protein
MNTLEAVETPSSENSVGQPEITNAGFYFNISTKLLSVSGMISQRY